MENFTILVLLTSEKLLNSLFDITQFLLEDLESLNQKINSKYFPFFWRYKKSIRISRPNNMTNINL